MLINVATLLEEPVGSTRRYAADGERVAVPEAGYARVVDGRVSLIRSTRGVLVHADFALRARLECSRCLAPIDELLPVEFDEEFVPERRPDTGEPTPDLRPEEFRIDDHRHLDLSEAVRQYEHAAIPLQPLCRADCAGLCPVCGQNRNEALCDCETEQADERWSTLAGLAERLRDEEQD